MKNKMMTGLGLVLSSIMFLTNCKTTKGTGNVSGATVSYEKDIMPVIAEKCAPCHFPGGKVAMLDDHGSVKRQINDIIRRVKLPETDPEYMPFKSKKPALTAAEITALEQWKAQDFPRLN